MKKPVLTTVPPDAVSAASEDRTVREGGEFTQLRLRAEDDPQRLHGRVMDVLDHYFLKRKLTYLSTQRDALQHIVEAVLDETLFGKLRQYIVET